MTRERRRAERVETVGERVGWRGLWRLALAAAALWIASPPPIGATDAPTPAQVQLDSIHAAADGLVLLGHPNVYATVGRDVLAVTLPRAVQAQVPEVSSLALDLGDQDIVATVGFDLGDPGASVAGTVEIHLGVAIEDSALFLRPLVSRLQLGSSAVDGGDDASSLAELLDSLNAALGAQRIPIELHSLYTVDPVQLFQGIPNLTRSSADKIQVDAALGRSVVMVDPDGIHLLAEVVNLTSSRAAAILAELKQVTVGGGMPLTSNQLALLGECDRAGAAAGLAGFQELCATWSGHTLSGQGAGVGAGAAPSEDVATAYASLRQKFLAAAAGLVRLGDVAWSKTALAVSRDFVAQSLNELLAGEHIEGSFAFPPFEPTFKETITTPDAPNLNCDNRRACPSVFDYPAYVPRGCESDCGFDLGCIGRKVDCERLKASEGLAYDAARNAALGAWTAQKLACEAAKTAEELGCEANQSWLQAVGGQDFGEVAGHASIVGGYLDLIVESLTVGAELESLSMQASLHAQARIGADFQVTPHGLGNIVCLAEWSGRVEAVASVPTTEVVATSSLAPVKQDGSGVDLVFHTPPQSLGLELSPPPAEALLAQNPQLALACPVPATILGTITGGFPATGLLFALPLDQLDLMDTVTFEVPAQDLALHLGTRTFDLFGSKLTVTPSWQEHTIVFFVG